MGGNIALRLSQTVPDLISGLICLVPLVELRAKVLKFKWARHAVHWASAFVGNLGVKITGKNRSCKHQAAYDHIVRDPLFYDGEIELRTLKALMHSCEKLGDSIDQINHPLILF
jgi:alpha-beta hydrolase superfamily lysophospholipase